VPDSVLSDLRVIELSQGIAGPYCGKLLAEYGADVVKVEPPNGGDPSRSMGPFPDDLPHPEKSGLFLHLNTGKESLTLDIATASGALILKQLLTNADVLLESSPPGQMSQWGLGYDDLREEFPGLIYVSITPFGQTGPYRDYEGNSITAIAAAGLMCLTGDPEREPLATGGEPAEYFAGLQAWVGALAALTYRDQEDVGQQVDVSVTEAAAITDESVTACYAFMGVIRRRFYSRHIWGYPQDPFPCKDGHVIVHPGAQGLPSALAGTGASGLSLLLGDLELDSDPLFTDRWQRWFRWREFDSLLEPYLSTHTADEIVEVAQALRMPFAPVLDAAQLLENQHLGERGYFKELDHPEAGKLRYTGELFRMSESPWRLGRAPTLGEHNESILVDELGYRKEDLAILRDRGII
jgi:crotonobetainyl-CoA:carnitine CoA-transferase CaiB-like acyl-CoA transferase